MDSPGTLWWARAWPHEAVLRLLASLVLSHAVCVHARWPLMPCPSTARLAHAGILPDYKGVH